MEEKAIKSSSEMSGFCKDVAAKMANFFTEETYPLNSEDLQPFFRVIEEEVGALMAGEPIPEPEQTPD